MFIQVQEGASRCTRSPRGHGQSLPTEGKFKQGKWDFWRSGNLKDAHSQGLHPGASGIIVGHKACHALREGLRPLGRKGETQVSRH